MLNADVDITGLSGKVSVSRLSSTAGALLVGLALSLTVMNWLPESPAGIAKVIVADPVLSVAEPVEYAVDPIVNLIALVGANPRTVNVILPGAGEVAPPAHGVTVKSDPAGVVVSKGSAL